LTERHWNTGILEYWNTGILEYWKDGILEGWNDGMMLVCGGELGVFKASGCESD